MRSLINQYTYTKHSEHAFPKTVFYLTSIPMRLSPPYQFLSQMHGIVLFCDI